jgi:glutamate/tyrosine decarboxylase-like PLP-dependent enzyme
MQKLGHEGYLDLAATTMETTERLQAGVADIDGLRVVGDPAMTIFAMKSTDPDLDAYAVHAELSERDWRVGRQQRPESVHLSVMYHHRDCVAEFLADLEAAVDAAREAPADDDRAPMYGMNAEMAQNGDYAALAKGLLNEEVYR